MIDFGDEFHLYGLEWVGFGDNDVLFLLLFDAEIWFSAEIVCTRLIILWR